MVNPPQTKPIPHQEQNVKHPLFWGAVSLSTLLTFLFYIPLFHNDFVFWDDPIFIIQNPNIRSLNASFFYWMWTTLDTGNWMPLSWLSLAFDYQLMGLNPQIYHLTNLIFHLINTTLVFLLSYKVLTIGFSLKEPSRFIQNHSWILLTSFLTAILFGLHPIHVESVAWAAERRDVLYSFFYLLSLIFYLDYVSSLNKSIAKWILCFLFFLLSLMSKPMAVSLPIVLWIMDFWPFRRLRSPWGKILLEKIPFLMTSLLLGVITFSAQSQAGAMGSHGGLPFSFRVMNAFHSFIFYLVKMAVPIHLVPFYPLLHPQENAFTFVNIASVLLVFLITFFCWKHWKKRPYLAGAWTFYLVCLLPASGILQTGLQAAGDRFTYLPSWSLFLLFSAVFSKLLLRNRAILAVSVGCLTIALGSATWNQLGIWNNSIVFWESVELVYPDVSQLVQSNLGQSYDHAGRLEDALKEYDRALAIPPLNPYILDLKAQVLLKENKIDEAIEALKSAIKLETEGDPTVPYLHLWMAYQAKGLQPEALSLMELATQKYPNSAPCQFYLGISYYNSKQLENTQKAFQKALNLEPTNPEYLVSLASLYQKQGQEKEAVDLYKQGIEKVPQEPRCYLNLGKIYLAQGLYSNAINVFKTAAQIQPNDPEIFQTLGMAYERQGQRDLAAQSYERAKYLENQTH